MIRQNTLISYWIKDFRERRAPARGSSLYTSFVGWIILCPPYTSWHFKTAKAVLLQTHRILVYNKESSA